VVQGKGKLTATENRPAPQGGYEPPRSPTATTGREQAGTMKAPGQGIGPFDAAMGKFPASGRASRARRCRKLGQRRDARWSRSSSATREVHQWRNADPEGGQDECCCSHHGGRSVKRLEDSRLQRCGEAVITSGPWVSRIHSRGRLALERRPGLTVGLTPTEHMPVRTLQPFPQLRWSRLPR